MMTVKKNQIKSSQSSSQTVKPYLWNRLISNEISFDLKGFDEKKLKKIFIIFSFILLAVLPFLSKDFNITGDELVHKENGENVLKYLESGGADTTYRHYKNLYLYGGLFDASAAAIYQTLGGDEYQVRHLLNAIFGAFLVIFTGIGARLLTRRWFIGIMAMIFTLLTPRLFGDMMNNPKDIPFAMACMALFCGSLRFNQMMPKWNWPSAILVLFAIFISLNIRVGGLLFLFYFIAYTGLNILLKRKLFLDSSVKLGIYILKLSVLVIVSFFIGIIFFPYSHKAPITNTLNALREMENFQIAIRMLFEGRALWSDEIPWYYIPKWLFIANPIFLLLGISLFVFQLKSLFKKFHPLEISFLIFVGFFPVFYAIYKHSALYDGIRHFLFIIPMLIIMACLGWVMVYKKLEAKPIKWLIPAICSILLLLPLRFMIANHPNEYIYFNELSGGIKKANGTYETDYWMNSIGILSKKLINTDTRIKNGKEVVLVTNSIDPVKHYFKNYSNVKLYYASFKDRYKYKADYYLSIPRFIESGLLKNGAWPNDNLIDKVNVDGVMVGALTSYIDTMTYAALNADKKRDFALAMNFYKIAIANNPKNDVALAGLINNYINVDSIAQSQKYLEMAFKLSLNNSDFLMLNGLLKLKLNKAYEAYEIFDRCSSENYRNVNAYYYKALILNAQKNTSDALTEINKAIQYAPNFKPAYLLASQILASAGDMNGAQRYSQAAEQIK